MLAARRVGPAGPPTIVLLHGLGAASSEWSRVLAVLERRGAARALAPDLLGFGRSRRRGGRFRLRDHVDALTELLEREGALAAPSTVIGHSFGAAVAVALAAEQPRLVARLVLVAPPVYARPAEARRRLVERSWMTRQTVDGTLSGWLLCTLVCALRHPLALAAPLLLPSLPAEVARDAFRHSWRAYRDAVVALLDENPLPAALAAPSVATVVVVGLLDETAPAAEATAAAAPGVRVVELPGGHLLPLTHPLELAALLQAPR